MLHATTMLRSAGRAAVASGTRRAMSSVKIEFPGAYEMHRLEKPEEHAMTNKEELIDFFTTMYTMRRMEITCDNEYKARTIRGFCHLYDGQEAIGTGINSVWEQEDCWITSYRCHCIMLARGGTVEGVLAELMGNSSGQTGGKGGSMHFYNKDMNFYGGQGIVGAQVPVGTGLAFANKYNTPAGEKMPVTIGCYGDGAANQGQIWEAANMAAIWKLPMIFCIENNQYGMGTSISRHSSNNDYFTMGNKIPGIKMDGMNVLAVREGMKFVKDYVANGNGPLFVEMSTYRYHGHSMSDPGTTYRNRDEIASMRASRDPIETVKKMLVEHCGSTDEELKEIEKKVRKEVADACVKAKAGSPPGIDQLATNIYLDTNGKSEFPPYIRMPDVTKSLVNGVPQA